MTEITLLDGSIGQELVKRSGDRATPLWSTQVMIDHPGIVRLVHDDYFAVGATVASTNTYAVLRDRLARVGLQDEVARLTDVAVGAAVAARDAHGSGRVAGAIGPLVQSYRPDLCPPASEAAALYAENVALLKDRVDLILLETMSSVDQARGGLMAAGLSGLPVWLGVTVMDDDGTRMRSGEALGDLAALVAEFGPEAVLINCTRPESVAAGLEIVKGFGLPFGAYANGFTCISAGFLGSAPTVDALEQRHDLTPAAYAEFAMGWVDQGASIVGGCCEVGPAHIEELARRLRAAGHDIV
ncbi:homocysteine S-methyltransferase family protein [Roseovarius mucosus]|uniref:homocysteine S-methyltransferase family protein n=1 Tax=Roseovarius mucosus TaxID=215743 RepID=UPI001C5F5849|nr:homocysteine S-methyltransferase family protein [Roseovarius mucosus]MBW4973811.1 homocysteine S-methyltransferase family protein [Roseovarius mucosus]